MDYSTFSGIGIAVVAGFARWRFPVISKPLATAGLFTGFGLIGLSQFHPVLPLVGFIFIALVALFAGIVDWHLQRSAAKAESVSSAGLISIDQSITSNNQSGGITSRNVGLSSDDRA